MLERTCTRVLAVVVCSLLLLVGQGCGTTNRTLAQDLAWERFTQCAPNHSSISLNRIDSDGRVWVTYGSADHQQTFNAWNECMKRAAVEQGKAGTTGTLHPPKLRLTMTAGRPVDGG